MSDDYVDDSESLFRRVSILGQAYDEGKLLISERAFLDSEKEPSVDRADLCNNDPLYTRMVPSDAVAKLTTIDVRAIESVVRRSGATGATIDHRYKIDVRPDPIKDDAALQDNLAHAKIYADQPLTSKPYRQLTAVLAFLAVVVLEPEP